jgi:hypothetical protein
MPNFQQRLQRLRWDVEAGRVRTIIALCLSLYALTLPVTFWAGSGVVLAPMPQGRKVEQVFPRKDSRWIVATAHIFTTPEEWNRVVVYEDTSLLSSGRYEIKPFSTDGSQCKRRYRSDDE